MKDLMMRAIDFAKLRGARYADVRVVQAIEQNITVKNGVVQTLANEETQGFGVRVLADGAWGFASSRDLSAPEVDRVTALALQIARASALVAGKRPVELGPAVTSVGSYATPFQIDPFAISTDDKLGLLFAADAAMARVAGVRVRQGSLTAIRECKWFANSEGAFTEQTIYETGGGIMAMAVGGDEVQRRSYPQTFGRQQVTAGWEAALGWDLPGNAERVATQAVQLLTADPCPREIRTDIILEGSQVALQVHESCGHPIELDRVYGTEAM